MKTEIERAAFDYINSESVKAENMKLAFGDFVNGAEWMQRKMIERACEWLESTLKSNLGYYGAADFADAFRKTMEE